MTVVDLYSLKDSVKRDQRVFGLDVGKRRLGVAMSDVSWTIASPLALIERKRLAADLEQLRKLAATHDVAAAILGLPVEMNGVEGRACQSIRQFGTDVAKVLGMPVAYWDERLSTTAVERMLIGDADLSRRRRAEVVDKAAATYILQGALDALANRAITVEQPSQS
jgi:putative Holliday junction resolvase